MTSSETRLGLIGCGAIGGAILDAFLQAELAPLRLVGVLTRRSNPALDRASNQYGIPCVHTLAELLALQPSLIVEAASHEAVREYALSIVEAGIDFLPMSVGAFAHGDLVAEITSKAEARGTKILISSGAIGGLDVLRASRAGGGLAQVTLTSTKRPAALTNQPYLIEHKVSVEGLSGPTVVFDGSAREACQAFPKSTNIAASVSLAGIGFDLTRVRVVANPDIPRTTHTLEARGSFGELRLTLQNLPHPKNPSTTNLACQGAVATLGNMLTPICFL